MKEIVRTDPALYFFIRKEENSRNFLRRIQERLSFIYAPCHSCFICGTISTSIESVTQAFSFTEGSGSQKGQFTEAESPLLNDKIPPQIEHFIWVLFEDMRSDKVDSRLLINATLK